MTCDCGAPGVNPVLKKKGDTDWRWLCEKCTTEALARFHLARPATVWEESKQLVRERTRQQKASADGDPNVRRALAAARALDKRCRFPIAEFPRGRRTHVAAMSPWGEVPFFDVTNRTASSLTDAGIERLTAKVFGIQRKVITT